MYPKTTAHCGLFQEIASRRLSSFRTPTTPMLGLFDSVSPTTSWAVTLREWRGGVANRFTAIGGWEPPPTRTGPGEGVGDTTGEGCEPGRATLAALTAVPPTKPADLAIACAILAAYRNN